MYGIDDCDGDVVVLSDGSGDETDDAISVDDGEAVPDVGVAADDGCDYFDSFNSKSYKFVRHFADGREIIGSMMPGPNGFALISFPGCDQKESEVPNIVLEVQEHVYKRPAAAGPPAVSDDDLPLSALVRTAAGSDMRPVVMKKPAAKSGLKSSERRRLYSRTYHSTKLKLTNEGKSDEEARALAQAAAQQACNERFG